MANGPHIQLVAQGAENTVLSGNPSTTFFSNIPVDNTIIFHQE